jgi:hypothetical protein
MVCGLVDIYHCFKGTYCHHQHGRRFHLEDGSREYHTSRCHISEDINLHYLHCDSLNVLNGSCTVTVLHFYEIALLKLQQ